MDDYTTNPTSLQPHQEPSEETLRVVYEVIAMLGDSLPNHATEWTPDLVMRWGANCLGLLLLRTGKVIPYKITGQALLMCEVDLYAPHDDEDGQR